METPCAKEKVGVDTSSEPKWLKIYRRLAAEVEQEKEIVKQGDSDA